MPHPESSTADMFSNPPLARQYPNVLEIHGDRRTDPYHWMRDRNHPELLPYLEAENAYTQIQMAHTTALQSQLYTEMLERIQETDLSVPYRHGPYFYYNRTEVGKAYPIFCRQRGPVEPERVEHLLKAPEGEDVLLDQNTLATGTSFFSLGTTAISPDHTCLAYSTDTNGSECYTLYIKDLAQRSLFSEAIVNVSDVVWANDGRTLFYTKLDVTHRPFQVWRHQIGTDSAFDELIYEELDEGFYLSVSRTRSGAYILLTSESKITSEIRVLLANCPTAPFQLIQKRQPGVEYSIDHHPGYGAEVGASCFYIVTNADGAANFKLMVAPVETPNREHWRTILPHRLHVMLKAIDVFAHHLVRYEREQGRPTIYIQALPMPDDPTPNEHQITFPEPTYSVYSAKMPEFDTQTLRFTYTSLITPSSVVDYDMESHQRQLKKKTPVLGGYDPTRYHSEWLMATASDGTQIPISLVGPKNTPQNGNAPVLLIGYGSYGHPYPVIFSSERLSLLDRGVVCAIAHIRGGGEMGRQWYSDGKLLQKKNTFTDFIACAEHLIESGWTQPEKLVISGGSAGGLLIGAVLNMRPDLFQGAIASVPFVDIVTTILDPSLPLSVLEWEEWGNPNELEFYTYMKSYSPYDNVCAQDYPHLLIKAGLNDPRVAYWEPAKWAAKLRALKTDQNRLLLHTNMDAGHGGGSGRYRRLKERALDYAFVLDCFGLES